MDAEDPEEANPKEPAEAGQMLSKPNFDVIIEKGGQKLMLSCSFAVEPAGEQEDFGEFSEISSTNFIANMNQSESHAYRAL